MNEKMPKPDDDDGDDMLPMQNTERILGIIEIP